MFMTTKSAAAVLAAALLAACATPNGGNGNGGNGNAGEPLNHEVFQEFTLAQPEPCDEKARRADCEPR